MSAIKAYNAQIDACATSQTAFNRTMLNASKTAQDMVINANGNTVALGNLTKASQASALGMKIFSTALNAVAFFAIVQAISAVISGLYKLTTASDDIAQKAKEIGDEFNESKSSISDYKSKIEELQNTINNSSSSIENVTDARKQLMGIQQELIEKFGDEKEVVDTITDAVNNQAGALDNLSKKKYIEAKNKFNDSSFSENISNKLDGYRDNMDRMVSEMENPIHLDSFDMSDPHKAGFKTKINVKDIHDFEDAISPYGKVNIIPSLMGGNGVDAIAIELSGGLESAYEKLLKIQEIAENYEGNSGWNDFKDAITAKINETKEKLDKYSDLYDNYILYEKILSKSGEKKGYTQSYEKVNNAMKAYADAQLTGDEEQIRRAEEEYAAILSEEMGKVSPSDENVKNYLYNLYPEMQEIVGKWNFQYDLKSKTDDKKELQDALSKFSGTNEIKEYDKDTSRDKKKNEAYTYLEGYAAQYDLTLDQLIEKLQELGMVQDEAYNELVSIFGKDNISQLSDYKLKLAYSIENVGDMTFEEFQEAIAKKKKEAEVSFAPKTFKQAWNALGTTGDDATNSAALETKEKLLELAEAGKLTINAFEDSSIATQFMKDTALSAEEATKKINELVDSTQQLSAMKTGITAITSVYDEKKDSQDHRVGTDTLNSLRNTLGIDDSWSEKDLQVWKDYKDAATDTGTSLKDFKKHQDALASSYINSNNFLSQLNGTNKDYYISTLREMGIDNASAVVKQILAQKISQENQDKINLALSTINLSDGIQNNEVLALSNEAAWLATASEATKQYYLQKLLANENSLNSSDSIANLKALAEQAGITGTTISELTTLLQMQRMYESMAENVKSTPALETLKKQIEKQKEVVINSANRKPKTKVETTKGT